MADARDLERYLHTHIPLSAAMAATVAGLSAEEVTLQAPLGPNLNHRGTVFGGSAVSLAILSAWALVHTRLGAEGLTARLVIQRHGMTYDLPLDGAFSATARLAEPEAWPRFLKTLRRMGRARVSVVAEVQAAGRAAGRFEGDFVALGPAGSGDPGSRTG